MGVVFLYLYYITFYMACMAIFGDWEHDGRHCLAPCVRAKKVDRKYETKLTEEKGERTVEHVREESISSSIFRRYYGPFVTSRNTMAFVVVAYIVYVAVFSVGLAKVTEGLDPTNLVMDGNPFKMYHEYMVQTFYSKGSLCLRVDHDVQARRSTCSSTMRRT